MVIGHESAGTVVEVGEGVQHLQVCMQTLLIDACMHIYIHSHFVDRPMPVECVYVSTTLYAQLILWGFACRFRHPQA